MESITLQRGRARAQQFDPKVFLPKLDMRHAPETVTELDQVIRECFLNQPVPIFSWLKNIENRGHRDIVSPAAEPQPLTGLRESHRDSSADHGLRATEVVLRYKASNLDIGDPGPSSNITCNSDGLRNPDSDPRSVSSSNDDELENLGLHPDPIVSGVPLPEARDQIIAMELADDIDQAMFLARNAISTAETVVDRAKGRVSLGLFLYQKYIAMRAAEHLDKALASTQKAIHSQSLDNNGLANAQNNLSIFLKERFLMHQNKRDLHQAIETARGAIEKAQGHALATCLSNLTSFLIRRYQVAGDQADLDEAVQSSRRALKIATEAHSDNSGLLNNLAGTWAERFSSIGNIADIDEAVYLARQAVEKATKGSSSEAGALSTLAACLYQRAMRLTDINNLDKAIQAAQKSYNLTTSSDTNGSRILCNLGMMLGKRYQFSQSLGDLHQSIKKIEQAVLETPLPDPERAARLDSLGLAHYNRFMVIRKDDLYDLEYALLRYA